MTTEKIMHWQDILDEVEDPNISEDKFIQETLGRPGGTTSRMIEPADVMALGTGEGYFPGDFEEALKRVEGKLSPLIYSIDWGGGADPLGKLAEAAGQSRTAVTLWHCVVENRRIRMKMLYHKVYPLEHPSASIDDILNDISLLPSGSILTADALGGTYGNDKIRRFVMNQGKKMRFIPIQLGEAGGSFKLNTEKDRLVVHRSKMLTKFFLKVKEKELILPSPTPLIKEITQHYVAEVEFENELGKRIWRKKAGTCDDVLFCSLFAFVAYGYFYNQAELKD